MTTPKKEYSLWRSDENMILRLCIIKYGSGNWQKHFARHLPERTNATMRNRASLLFGQQALKEFQNIRMDPIRIKKQKNLDGFHKNKGSELTPEIIQMKKQENKQKYELPKYITDRIQIPALMRWPHDIKTTKHKILKLKQLYLALDAMETKIKNIDNTKPESSSEIINPPNTSHKRSRKEFEYKQTTLTQMFPKRQKK